MDELLGDFLTETGESLDLLDSELVRFEREPSNADMLNAIFRLVHTVKGTCGFLGLPRLAKLAHAAETLMGQYRDGAPVTADGVTLILESVDRIKLIMSELERDGVEPRGSDADLIAALEGLAESNRGRDRSALATRPLEPDWREPLRAAEDDSPQAIEDGEATEKNATDSVARSQTVRVNVDTLEHLMTTVSELVLTRNQLLEIVRKDGENALKAPLQRLSNVTAELQDGIMKARLQPISNAWQKLPRLVRELSLDLGKKIELTMRGGETELDRQVLELIKDPLTHMVRNSAGHGIETEAGRRAAGKPTVGRIELSASQQGGYIVIEVADDGQGLDPKKIRDKVVGLGLASQADLNHLSDSEIYRFIFKAGFSTADTVTGVSGRGVGMDVVRNNIEMMGGSVELKSTSPQGTVFVIKIPLTLAIMSTLIVEARGQRFAIPQFSVVQLVRAGPSTEHRIERINETRVLRLLDKLLPLLDLSELLKLGERRAGLPRADAARIVVVMQVGTRVFGVVVDSVFHTEEIVVKPLASLIRDVAMFSGNTILGDGSVIMIIDPNALAGLIGAVEAPGEEMTRQRVAEAASEKTTALLLFRAGSEVPKAVPLSLITRLEEIDVSAIERCNGEDVVQYRGQLMPLVYMDQGSKRGEGEVQPVLVFTEGGRAVGLAVDAIVDIVEDRLHIEIGSDEAGIAGSAIVRGKAAEIVDVSHYLAKVVSKPLISNGNQSAQRVRVLVVDDSEFFRDMLAPLLSAHGYEAMPASSGAEALKLKAEGRSFDIIVSDLDMPDMDGFALAEAIKHDPRCGKIPLIALSSQVSPRLAERTRAAGFINCIGKFDRQLLLATLEECCKRRERAA
jgi:two-component system chemotaxis sensor kinase CheA